jgi:hypothetical protein
MTNKSRLWTNVIRLLALATLLLAAVPSNARTIRIDFGDANFALSGEAFDGFGLPGTGATTSFMLNLGAPGGAQFYDFCFNQNGFMTLAAAGGAGCTYSETPTGDFIAPYFSTTLVPEGNSSWSAGFVDSTEPFVLDANTPEAYRFIWEDLGAGVETELMLMDRGSGNFDLELRYGNDAISGTESGAPPGGQQGFTLGSNTLPLTGSASGFSSATLYLYSFVNGVCTTCGGTPPVDVPEPPIVLLFAAAFVAVALARTSRRRRLLVGDVAAAS